MRCLPIDIAELMLSLASLQSNGYIEGSARGNGSSNSGHCDGCNVFELDVRRGLRNKHEGLVEAVQEAFVSFDRALDP